MSNVTLHLPLDLWVIEGLRDDHHVTADIATLDESAFTVTFPGNVIDEIVCRLRVLAEGCEGQGSPRSAAFLHGIVAGLKAHPEFSSLDACGRCDNCSRDLLPCQNGRADT